MGASEVLAELSKRVSEKLEQDKVAGENKERPKIVDVVDVQRHGTKIILPEGMSNVRAADHLLKLEEYDNQEVEFHEPINGFVWDAAAALRVVIDRKFGFSMGIATPGFFGEKPPQMIGVEIDVNKTIQVPWGRFTLPGMNGFLQTSTSRSGDGMTILELAGKTSRKYQHIVSEIAEDTRKELSVRSIYRSKAIRLQFKDGRSVKEIPDVRFVDLSGIDPESLFFNEDVAVQINTNIYTPILNTEECLRCGIPLKRGIVLAGNYGTGKTLVAAATAKYATQNGWTFIYINSVDELSTAIQFARMYKRCIIFAEDIDRAATLTREDDVNEILNTIDGIDTKSSQIMVILTTNHVEMINPAMLRPGRLDSVIIVEPPDKETVQRLCRYYAGALLDKDENIEAVGLELAGVIPAVIRECVERAKLYAISLGHHKNGAAFLDCSALLHSAKGLKKQLELINKKPDLQVSGGDAFVAEIVSKVGDALDNRDSGNKEE